MQIQENLPEGYYKCFDYRGNSKLEYLTSAEAEHKNKKPSDFLDTYEKQALFRIIGTIF